MKNVILSFCFCLSIISYSSAQEPIADIIDLSTGIKKGDIVGDVFFGFPNFYKGFFENFNYSDGDGSVTTKTTGIGPLGARVEYMIGDKFGLGVESAYVYGKVERTYSTAYNDSVFYTGYTKRSKLGIIATFNYHFSDHDKFDAYVTGGLGYKISNVERKDQYFEADFSLNLPVAWRFGFGARFYPVPFIGISMNAGVGQGGLINFGVSYKF